MIIRKLSKELPRSALTTLTALEFYPGNGSPRLGHFPNLTLLTLRKAPVIGSSSYVLLMHFLKSRNFHTLNRFSHFLFEWPYFSTCRRNEEMVDLKKRGDKVKEHSELIYSQRMELINFKLNQIKQTTQMKTNNHDNDDEVDSEQ